MNREIKFRAFNSNDKEMYGDGVAKFLLYKEVIGEPIPEQFTIMQYTGLKDKNGTEIYEGDVVTDGSYADMSTKFRGLIGWSKGSWVIIQSNCECGECLNDRIERYEDLEIIGNIFEHPHLINHPL